MKLDKDCLATISAQLHGAGVKDLICATMTITI